MNTLWFSIPTTTNYFKWYAGTTNIATLEANGSFSINGFISAGANATTRSLTGSAFALSSGAFSSAGDAQSRTVTLRCSTTNGTQTVMTSDGSAQDTYNHLSLPNDTTYAFSALIVARRTDANDESAGWKIEGVIDRNATAGTTALVGSIIITTIGGDSSWSVDAVADTAYGSLKILVTGEASKTIRWVAKVDTVEVTG